MFNIQRSHELLPAHGPDVAAAPESIELQIIEGHGFRLQKIDQTEVFLRGEILERERLAKKRSRTAWICDESKGLGSVDGNVRLCRMALLSTTTVAAPVVIGLEAGSLLAGAGLALQQGAKFARKKPEKRDRSTYVDPSKLDSILDITSRALR